MSCQLEVKVESKCNSLRDNVENIRLEINDRLAEAKSQQNVAVSLLQETREIVRELNSSNCNKLSFRVDGPLNSGNDNSTPLLHDEIDSKHRNAIRSYTNSGYLYAYHDETAGDAESDISSNREDNGKVESCTNEESNKMHQTENEPSRDNKANDRQMVDGPSNGDVYNEQFEQVRDFIIYEHDVTDSHPPGDVGNGDDSFNVCDYTDCEDIYETGSLASEISSVTREFFKCSDLEDCDASKPESRENIYQDSSCLSESSENSDLESTGKSDTSDSNLCLKELFGDLDDKAKEKKEKRRKKRKRKSKELNRSHYERDISTKSVEERTEVRQTTNISKPDHEQDSIQTDDSKTESSSRKTKFGVTSKIRNFGLNLRGNMLKIMMAMVFIFCVGAV